MPQLFMIGAFMRGNNPPVLLEAKKASSKVKTVSFMQAECC